MIDDASSEFSIIRSYIARPCLPAVPRQRTESPRRPHFEARRGPAGQPFLPWLRRDQGCAGVDCGTGGSVPMAAGGSSAPGSGRISR